MSYMMKYVWKKDKSNKLKMKLTKIYTFSIVSYFLDKKNEDLKQITLTQTLKQFY